jgi:acyl-CoA synthetase (AMP-forming)/AMP-acid ligase II
MASAYGMAVALELSADDVGALAFPFTHIGGIGLLCATLMSGSRAIVIEAFDPPTTIPLLQREGVTLAGSGTPFHMAYLAAQREQPDTPLFPKVRAFPGGAAPKPPQLHYDIVAEMGSVGVVSGYGLTECPIITMGAVRDTDQHLADTEGAATPGVEIKVVTLDGKIAGPDEEGEIRARARSCSAAISTRRSTPTPSTRRGSSAPATSANSTPRATSRSRAGSRT